MKKHDFEKPKHAKSGMPIQAIPVERQITGAAIAADSGIEASGWWYPLVGAAKAVIPIIARQIASKF